ncbi:MAG TPA: hypothetical protein VMB03_22170 [Bryobacteraceae bacterium]|nr:hypothetical protein [Bryobacteraceae bacterium]
MQITDELRRLSTLALLACCLTASAYAQSFPSGSTGADGNLNITAPGVTVFTQTPAGGGTVYNFGTINIAQGSTLKLSGAVFSQPLYFLATGAVTIAGTLDLSGQSGSQPASSAQRTAGTTPGPGAYGGGLAAFGSDAALPGQGPSGGAVSVYYCCNYYVGGPGGFSGNQFLVPLVGGSGGGGQVGTGGAGGGAILIASSVSIAVTGTITASGGAGSANSGGGSGGGVRLVAPSISGTGTITAAGGGPGGTYNSSNNGGGNGVVRLEFFQNTFTGTTAGTLYTATPVNLYVPAPSAQPTIMVTSIGGIAVPANPTGSFTVPDVLLNTSSPLTVNIQASNIPLGTAPVIYFSTQNFPDQAITAGALAGTLAQSTSTATVTLNPGYSIGYVTATWKQ